MGLGHLYQECGLQSSDEVGTLAETQISAYVSDTTKEEVERYVSSHGVELGRLLEDALLYHLRALRELPADILIPPQLELERESFAEVAGLTKKARRPSRLLRHLMDGRSIDGK